jgi:anaerobic selenocysteine-containing dehydrogenase
VAELFKRFLTVYGSPNFFRPPSLQDSYETALYLSQGVRAVAGFDLGDADFVLSFGSGLIEGWSSPVYMFQARAAMREAGGSIHQLEPRLSKTAAKSDQWIPVNPGTEGALALGIAHVLLQEGKYDRTFVQDFASGFPSFQRMVRDGYAPESVSQITGVPPDRIVAVARGFAQAGKPLAVCGRGKGDVPVSLQTALAVHALNAMAGSINRPGGLVAVPEPAYIEWPDVEMDRIASDGMQQPRIDGAGSAEFPHARYLLNRLPQAVNEAGESPLQVLFVSGANPVYAQHGAQDFLTAIEKIPLVVSFSSYLDETSAAADMILPNHMYLERYEDVPAVFGFPRPLVGLVQPAVYPLFNTRYAGDVLIQLASELGGTIAAAFEWENYETCLQETLADQWDTLVDEGYAVDADFSPAGWADGFETASMKFEFHNSDIDAALGYQPLGPEGQASEYPLLLIPYDTMRLATRHIGSPPFLIKSLEDTILRQKEVLVEINPATAREFGLSEGRRVKLTTPVGSARVKIHLAEGIMPGLVAMPRGLGHTAFDAFLAGNGANVNQLIGPVEDPVSGLDVAWGIRAKLA